MKICVVMLARKFGGAERFYVDLTNGLARRGHDVLAISNARSKAALHLEKLPNSNRASVRVLGPWDPLAPRKITKLVRAFAPQVIQTSLSRAAHLAGPASHRLNIPLVAHTHDFVDLKYFRHADVFTPTTAAQRDYLLNEGIAAAGVRWIPNFSSLSPVSAIRCRDEVTKIVALGRFVHKKGFDMLLRSLSRLARHDIRLYLAGDGVERQRLMGLAADLNIGKKSTLPAGRTMYAVSCCRATSSCCLPGMNHSALRSSKPWPAACPSWRPNATARLKYWMPAAPGFATPTRIR